MSIFNVQPRSRSTSKPKQLRRDGLLPMALVERTHQTMLIQAPVEALRKAMHSADGLGRLDIQIEGEKTPRKAIVKHIEQDALKHMLIHVTLQEVTEDDQVKMDVPVVAIGEPTAMETEDLMLMAVTDHVKLRGRLADMPDHLEVDVTGLEPGHHIEAGNVQLPAGIELMSSADATLFSLRSREEATAEPEPTEGTGADEPSETPTEDELADNG